MKKAILFIHGLGGGKKTWGLFPKLIEKSLLNYDPIIYNYPTSLIKFLPLFRNRFPSIQTLAKGLDTYIRNKLSQYDEIALAGHSLGGLVIKYYLLDQFDNNNHINTKKIIFYAVPNTGSGLANIGRIQSYCNPQIRELRAYSDTLNQLNDRWNSHHLENLYDFKIVVAGKDQIISNHSATDGFNHLPQGTTETIADRNHRNIKKPKDFQDLSFIILKNFLEKSSSISANNFPTIYNFNEWKEILDIKSNFFTDERRTRQLETLVQALKKKGNILRIIGLSGVGKTRLIFEAANSLSNQLKNNLLYADLDLAEDELRLALPNWGANDSEGILILDNCSAKQHSTFYNHIKRNKNLTLVTIDFDTTSTLPCKTIKLKPLSDEQIQNILKNLFGKKLQDLQRVAKFAQGFPRIAVLLAEDRIGEVEDLGQLTDSTLAKRLIGEKTPQQENALEVFSLFDHFGFQNDVKQDIEYLAQNLIVCTYDQCYRYLAEAKKRGIIICRGDYAQLAPKPLAIYLSANWWNNTAPERQRELFANIPENLLDSFCDQLQKLYFLPNAKTFARNLCGDTGPFGCADVVLTNKGARTFRTIAKLNPTASAHAIAKILNALSHDELEKINSDIRQHLVWALEILLFRKESFSDASDALLVLALSEREAWSNNSKSLFIQLFGLCLSGTEAPPPSKWQLIEKLIEKQNDEAITLAIQALANALEGKHFSRSGGAECQGGFSTLKDWEPTSYEDVFSYWDTAINYLLQIAQSHPHFTSLAFNSIADYARSLFEFGQIEQLDKTVSLWTSMHRGYWPEMLASIKDIKKYLPPKQIACHQEPLQKWEGMILPQTTKDKFQHFISNPKWEYQEIKGQLVSLSEKNAENFSMRYDPIEGMLDDNIPTLLTGNQPYLHIFCKHVLPKIKDLELFCRTVSSALKEAPEPNPKLLALSLRELRSSSSSKWGKLMEQFSKDTFLQPFYIDLWSASRPRSADLRSLRELISIGSVDIKQIDTLSLGISLHNVEVKDVASFCKDLAEINLNKYASVGFEILYSRCSQDNSWDSVSEIIKLLVLDTDWTKKSGSQLLDYHWSKACIRFIPTDIAFSQKLAKQIFHRIAQKDYSFNISNAGRDVFSCLIEHLRFKAWDLISTPLLKQPIYWSRFKILIGNDVLTPQSPTLIDKIPPEDILNWVKSNGEDAARFLIKVYPLFSETEGEYTISPLILSLLEYYENSGNVLSSFIYTLESFSWSGSALPHLTKRIDMLKQQLVPHRSPNIRTFATQAINQLKERKNMEEKKDEERSIGIY